MKINPLSSYLYPPSYLKAAGRAQRTAAPQPESAGKTDMISFSPGAREQQEISQVSSRIVGELNEPESPSLLQALQNAIANNSYRVSADELADAILNRGALR